MNRFRGRYDYSIDAKGRVNIPARFRKAISPDAGGTFVISRGPDRCILAYPEDEWRKKEDNLRALPVTKETEKTLRLMSSSVFEVSLDSQGRIVIAPKLAKIAGLKKNVTLVGRVGFIEIWDTDRFNEYEGAENDFDNDGFDEAFYESMRLVSGNSEK